MLFVCPKCGGALSYSGGAAVCRDGHSFDRASEGYYNLLLGHKKGNRGDNSEMVAARRAFLGGGYYLPLASRVAQLVCELTPKGGAVLDAGCGEGYYTDLAEKALLERDGCSRVSGFDISRDAVRRAAKRNPRISLAVAGSYHMPISDGSVDTVMNTFSPLAAEETYRVLRDGGVFVMAIPAEEHLYELKAAIYDTPYKNTVADTALEGFELILDEPLRFTVSLRSREAVSSLFKMTPYAYRTRFADAARIEELDFLDVSADFRIFSYRKIGKTGSEKA